MTERIRIHQALAPCNDAERRLLASVIDNVFFFEPLFDALPDVVFFVKDTECRYVLVNQALVNRCGLKEKSALVGRNVAEVFPSAFGHIFLQQDKAVLASGGQIHNQLELHLYPNRDPGWCLTHKIPLFDAHRKVVGVAGISRDLAMPDQKHPVYQRVANAANYIQDNYDQQIQLSDLAAIAGLSVSQIERYFYKIFYLTPRQMIIKTRLDAASTMLGGEHNITEIAATCGYHDHSAFTRQFKTTVGMTPSEYRAMLKSN
ncbi:helix-turn-helix domain-containing protein [Glaciimonas sp. GG7]